MTKAKSTIASGRIFPQIQWTEEHKAKRRAERNKFHQRCQVIFDRSSVVKNSTVVCGYAV